MKKGSKLYIEGKLETSSWDDRQSGSKRYRTEIVARNIVLLGRHEDGEDNGNAKGNGLEHRQTHPSPSEITDEDIPF